MLRRFAIVLTIAALMGGVLVSGNTAYADANASASVAPFLDASLYPADAQLEAYNPYTSRDFDFAFAGGGFETRPQIQFHRITGLAVFAYFECGDKACDDPDNDPSGIAAITASTFKPANKKNQWNQFAMADWGSGIVQNYGMKIQHKNFGLVPKGWRGAEVVYTLDKYQGGPAVVASCWWGKGHAATFLMAGDPYGDVTLSDMLTMMTGQFHAIEQIAPAP